MADKIRVGVIGAGSWAISSHIPNFKRRPEVELVAVHRLEKELADQVKDDFGFQYATTNYKEVLEHELDVVLVSSPGGTHHEHAKAAMEAGAHVLCEKPFTITSADAWDLVDTSMRTNKHLLIAYGWNYKRMVIEAKQIMEQRGVGNIEAVMVHMASPTRELLNAQGSYDGASQYFNPAPSTWTDPRLSGGGFAQAQLSHALGLSLWLTDLSCAEVFAMTNNQAEIELHDAFSVRYTNGAIGSVFGASNTRGASKHQLEVRIFGNDGQMIVDLEREMVWWYRSPNEQINLEIKSGEGLYDCVGPVNAVVDLALQKAVDNQSPGDLGARTVEMIEAAYRSVKSGTIEKIPYHSRGRVDK